MTIVGFTGARESKLQCLPIAESTILHGYNMLVQLKEEIEKTFTREKGFPVDCTVVYGDTGISSLLLQGYQLLMRSSFNRFGVCKIPRYIGC